jgi:hypothetical protein
MSAFIETTINDLRGGRQSWRVFVLFTVPSFAVGALTALRF